MGNSAAFKCTYNDGEEEVLVGFGGTCLRDNIARNVQNDRVWCSNPGCACRQYYDLGMIGSKPQAPCYESELFHKWRYGAGWYHTGEKAGTPINMTQIEAGKIAILTTRFPNEPERDRRIVGLFQIGEVRQDPETIIVAAPKGRIHLPLEESNELFFWAYHNTTSGKPDWRTG